MAKVLIEDEGRRISSNIAKLRTLLGKAGWRSKMPPQVGSGLALCAIFTASLTPRLTSGGLCQGTRLFCRRMDELMRGELR